MKERKSTRNKAKKRASNGKKPREKNLPLHPFQTFLVGLLAGGLTWLSPLAKKEILSSPPSLPQNMVTSPYTLVEKENYSLAYDMRTHLASWVYEHLTPQNRAPELDPIVFEYRKNPLPLSSQQASLTTTTTISLAEPLWSNRDYWRKLEKRVHSWSSSYDKVHVVTGPLFLPRSYANGKRYVHYAVTGENDTPVPTHLYKVVLIENKGDIALKAYLLPNEYIPLAAPLADFEVSAQEVERLTGLTFFADILKAHML